MSELHIVPPSVGIYPTAEAYEAACAALEEHRERADAVEDVLRRVADVVADLDGAVSVDGAMSAADLDRAAGIGFAVERIRDVLPAAEEASRG